MVIWEMFVKVISEKFCENLLPEWCVAIHYEYTTSYYETKHV